MYSAVPELNYPIPGGGPEDWWTGGDECKHLHLQYLLDC